MPLALRPPLHRAAGAGAARVLTVEDEALIAWTLADCLEAAGHEVLGPGATAAEASALCEVAAAPPELAVLDIDLRDGSSGVEVARVLLERWGVRSILANARLVEDRWAGGVAFGRIGKPHAPEAVLRCVAPSTRSTAAKPASLIRRTRLAASGGTGRPHASASLVTFSARRARTRAPLGFELAAPLPAWPRSKNKRTSRHRPSSPPCSASSPKDGRGGGGRASDPCRP